MSEPNTPTKDVSPTEEERGKHMNAAAEILSGKKPTEMSVAEFWGVAPDDGDLQIFEEITNLAMEGGDPNQQ